MKTAEIDDLVLQLKGLVLVRRLRATRGADDSELGMYSAEIDRLRDRLADFVRGGEPAAVS
ncbi:MAG TPA: hypothetical protein VIZ29_02085 [Gaiellaceae bacterium]